ncbi:MAG: hypothetical protein WDW38_005782 [Sanguina aurantia]
MPTFVQGKGDEVLSKAFHARSGKAYLFNHVVNVVVGEPEERYMTTGLHVVRDIYCSACKCRTPLSAQPLGWRYEVANEEGQRYKEGKFCVERAAIMDLERYVGSSGGSSQGGSRSSMGADEGELFEDSEDGFEEAY